MGRIVFDTATTFNGWIADEDNSLSWLFAVEGGETPNGLFPSHATVLVEGSTTYEWVLAESGILAHPEKWREFHGVRPTFVFTTRQLPVPEGADVRLVSGPVADALPAIREAAVACGSGRRGSAPRVRGMHQTLSAEPHEDPVAQSSSRPVSLRSASAPGAMGSQKEASR